METNRSGARFVTFAVPTLLMMLVLGLADLARAQTSQFGKTSPPILGGLGISPEPANPFRAMTGTYAPNHKTPDGQLCIKVTAMSHPQVANPKITEQVVLVENICGQAIRVQVCYAGSHDCVIIPLTGYQRLQRLLGISANSTAFRFEYRELY